MLAFADVVAADFTAAVADDVLAAAGDVAVAVFSTGAFTGLPFCPKAGPVRTRQRNKLMCKSL
jgi:hypothetical protein